MSASASGRRPPELDDRNWLRARYEEVGDTAIATELSARHGYPVSRGMVRLARERLGIPSLPPGRRRGPLQIAGPAGHKAGSGEIVLTGTALAIIARFQHDQLNHGHGKPPPTRTLLGAAVLAFTEAERNGDELAMDDALLAICSAAGLIHQHRQKLRSGL